MPATCDTSINASKSTTVVNNVDAEKAAELRMLQQIQLEAAKPYAEAYSKVKAPKAARPVYPVVTDEERALADSKSVFVRNVNYGTTIEELEHHFLGCGLIKRTTIPTTYNGKQKGVAFVEFADVEGKQNALIMNNSTFKGRQITVEDKRTNLRGFAPAVKVVYRVHRNHQVIFHGAKKLANRAKPY